MKTLRENEKALDLRIERLQHCASGATNYQPVL